MGGNSTLRSVETPFVYELVGYVGSALVLGSIVQRSIFRLRWLGVIGGVVFLTYSLLIEAYPIAVVNVVATAIHAYYLRELLLKPDESFSILHVLPDSEYVRYFLDFYADDIDRFFPGLPEVNEDLVMVFVLRDTVPAGLYIGVREGDRLRTLMDYAQPQYRDLKVGRFLYSHTHEVFDPKGVRYITARTESPTHGRYLQKMGFVRSGDEFVLDMEAV